MHCVSKESIQLLNVMTDAHDLTETNFFPLDRIVTMDLHDYHRPFIIDMYTPISNELCDV